MKRSIHLAAQRSRIEQGEARNFYLICLFAYGIRGSMADQLQHVLFGIVKKQGSRGHRWKHDGTGTYAERFEPFFFSLIALGRDLESKVVQRRSSGVVPVEPPLDKNVPLKIDQGEQLGMTMPAKWAIGLLDR
jgi:hypothetical protein